MRRVLRLALTLVILSVGAAGARAQLADNGDGTITDLQTGLMWLKNANHAGTPMTHDQAKAWAQNLVYAGHDDWRLPSGADPGGTVCNSRPTGSNCTQTEFASLYFAHTIQVFAPGPFENIQYRNYWTSTDWPPDPTRAMAQDFEDGGQNDFPKTDAYWAWAVRDAGIPPGTPMLYGVISQDPNVGYLIKINPVTAAATLVGNTGLLQPCSLTYNDPRAILYVNECFGTSGLHTVDPSTGATAPLWSVTGSVVAYRFGDDMLYSIDNDIDFATVWQSNSLTGASTGFIGSLGKGPVTAATVRPADGKLIGAGYANLLAQRWLFTIPTTPGPPPLEQNLAQLNTAFTGLAFHPNGTLYATNGTGLFTVNPATGTASFIGSFGPTVGLVDGLAWVYPPIPRRPDVWMRDCLADIGQTPSYPLPCATWTNSPDIKIANSVWPFPSLAVANQLRATVRNRGLVRATGVRVDFYWGRLGMTTGFDNATPIGRVTVSVPAQGSALASISWSPPAGIGTSGWCLGVALRHSADPPIQPFVLPPYDNNLAVKCSGLLTILPGAVTRYGFSFGRGDGSFGFRQWRGEFMFRAQASLPAGWSWSFQGLDLDRAVKLPPGEARTAELVIAAPQDAAPHSGGTIDLAQIDLTTGRILGSIRWVVTEDGHPPEPPRNVRVALRQADLVLAWDSVTHEAETGLDENVVAYEVLRDGQVVAKMVQDADSAAPGIQWIDPGRARSRSRYAVRAVDVAGNVSKPSAEVTATPQRRSRNQ